MRREKVTLMMLAAAKGKPYTPVQIQKAMFLLSEEAAALFSPGSRYRFVPYDYGPFDAAVYDDLRALQAAGLATVDKDDRYGWRCYSATPAGIKEGEQLLERIPSERRGYLVRVSKFVRSLSFQQLVSAIYRAYPAMRARSVFIEK